MSLLYLLALLVAWLFVGWVIYRICRRWKPETFMGKSVHVAIGFLLFAVWFGGAFWQVAGKTLYWDAKVREMCAKDGGITVYETVDLPPDRFNKWGQPNFYHPVNGENALGGEYIFKIEKHYFHQADPRVSRRSYKVFRRGDNKLLGQSIIYGRGGGLPGPWHDSSFHCPDEGGDIPLFIKIFNPSNKE